MSEQVVAYIDGGARGNPGPAGYGVRIEHGEGTLLDELHAPIGVATNNVAEYRGLLAALTYLRARGYRDVRIRSDSELLVRQMRGHYRVRNPGLQQLHQEASELLAHFDRVVFEHVPRSQNAAADRLANLAMDEAAARSGRAARAAREGAQAAGDAEPAAPTGTSRPTPGRAAARATGVDIIGVGLDAEDIARVDQLVQRYGDRFLRRVFTNGEIEYCLARARPAQHLAARFAAKEAAMKALGTGRALGVLWREVEVVRAGGPPQLRFHGGAARRFAALGGHKALLSLTHTQHLALAQVLLIGR